MDGRYITLSAITKPTQNKRFEAGRNGMRSDAVATGMTINFSRLIVDTEEKEEEEDVRIQTKYKIKEMRKDRSTNDMIFRESENVVTRGTESKDQS